MTVTETLIRKIIDLPEECRWKVLTFVEHLELESSGKQQLPIDPYGLCADIRSDLSFEEFQKNRQEMWGGSTDTEVQ